MSKEKISSQEIIDLLASKAGISKKAAEDFLKSMFGIIEDTLIAGEQVKVKGFGTFKLQWNEPRKSVNVQTGEEFIIDGYNKVTFTPEAALKELVNEPFAHLEPVELESADTVEPSNAENQAVENAGFDPLKIFTDQADEIKDILSEINSMWVKPGKAENKETAKPERPTLMPEYFTDDMLDEEEDEEPEVSAIDEEDEDAANEEYIGDVVDEDEEPAQAIADSLPVDNIEPGVVDVPVLPLLTANKSEMEPTVVEETSEEFNPDEVTKTGSVPEEVVDESTIGENIPEDETIKNDPFTSRVKKKRRKVRVWLLVVLILLVLAGGFTINYYLSSATRCWCEYSLLSDSNRQKLQNVTSTIDGWFESVKGWFTPKAKSEKVEVAPPVVKSIFTDSIKAQPAAVDTTQTKSVSKPQPSPSADSLQILFDQPREYKEFLGSERIGGGGTLTVIAERYYGHRDFWVYIYEANRAKIKNPDKIAAGTLVRIPKVDKRIVDKNNPRCIKKARELHSLYLRDN